MWSNNVWHVTNLEKAALQEITPNAVRLPVYLPDEEHRVGDVIEVPNANNIPVLCPIDAADPPQYHVVMIWEEYIRGGSNGSSWNDPCHWRHTTKLRRIQCR